MPGVTLVAKTALAPLDRVRLVLQTQRARIGTFVSAALYSVFLYA